MDTVANRTSVISESQYMSYCSELGPRRSIRGAADRQVKGIACLAKAICVVKVQISFKDLKLDIDVYFLVLTGEVATLLSIRGMMTKIWIFQYKDVKSLMAVTNSRYRWRISSSFIDGG